VVGVTEASGGPDEPSAHGDRTRSALVRAAQRLVAERLAAGVEVRSVARLAEVDVRSFHDHFESRGELFDTAVHGFLSELGDALDAVSDDAADPAVATARVLRLLGHLPDSHPHLAVVLAAGGLASAADPSGVAARLADTLAWGVDSGRFALDDPDIAAMALLGGLVAVLTARTYDRRLGASHVDGFVALALRMLGVPDAEARELVAQPVPAWQ